MIKSASKKILSVILVVAFFNLARTYGKCLKCKAVKY